MPRLMTASGTLGNRDTARPIASVRTGSWLTKQRPGRSVTTLSGALCATERIAEAVASHDIPASVLTKLNELGRANGIGRLDLVENRFVGMKSRGVYETPGGTILLAAHRGIESITLDREAAHLKDSLMPRFAEVIYNGFWFSPERRMLQALIDESQKSVSGRVRLKLYKGNVTCIGRESPNSLYSMQHVTFEDDQGAYDQFDAQGFIKLNALRLRLGAIAGRRGGSL